MIIRSSVISSTIIHWTNPYPIPYIVQVPNALLLHATRWIFFPASHGWSLKTLPPDQPHQSPREPAIVGARSLCQILSPMHIFSSEHTGTLFGIFVSYLAGSLGPLRQQGAKMCYSVLIQISQKVFFTPGIKISHKYLRHVQDLRGRCGCTSNLRGPFLTHAPTSSASSFPNAL